MTGQIKHLVKMANQIALNFGDWGDEELVVAKTGEHLKKFWTPAMLQQLLAYRQTGGDKLSPLVCRALAALEE
jgi:formate dehydrogenase subunit delta